MLSLYLAMLDDPGEKERFENIYYKYKDMMAKIALAILKDESYAYDATGDALLAIAKNIKTFPPETDEVYERAYVRKVIRNASINVLKKKKSQPKTVSINLDSYSEKNSSPADDLITSDVIAKILRCLNNMSESYRDILTFRYVYGMNSRDISTLLDLPHETVRTKIKRGTAMLKRSVEMENQK